MDTSKAKKTKKKAEGGIEREFITMTSAEVKNVRVVEAKNGDLVFFTAVINGVVIYNCRVATGKNGDFISFPQYKGSDGKYYNNVYVSLSDEDAAKILELVQTELNAE